MILVIRVLKVLKGLLEQQELRVLKETREPMVTKEPRVQLALMVTKVLRV